MRSAATGLHGQCRPERPGRPDLAGFVATARMNLHKTFAIPHGGGGPGMGRLAWRRLAPHGRPRCCCHGRCQPRDAGRGRFSAAQLGSASILISWMSSPCWAVRRKKAAQVAILNADYVAASSRITTMLRRQARPRRPRVHPGRPPIKAATGVGQIDIAKRLMTGFHARPSVGGRRDDR